MYHRLSAPSSFACRRTSASRSEVLLHPAAKPAQTAALTNGRFRDFSIVGERQNCRIPRQVAVCKNPRAARVADAVGGAFADCEGNQLQRGRFFREAPRQLDLSTELLCPQLRIVQRVDGRFRCAGVQKSDGRAPLLGKRMQLLQILVLPIGTAHGEKRIADVVMDADLHVQNFFLADDVRHFLAQLPQRLVCRVQPRVFLIQLCAYRRQF